MSERPERFVDQLNNQTTKVPRQPEPMALETAIQIAAEAIDEWDQEADPHGYWHERPMLIALLNAARSVQPPWSMLQLSLDEALYLKGLIGFTLEGDYHTMRLRNGLRARLSYLIDRYQEEERIETDG